ncbi:MAG: 3-phosphoshikimate 1-carboxyvinyltransferase [Phycisphaerales bacterium]|nr:3-phosphoshikimate 1-carboxyvinyltransferase [Phycisphaerales bacterium]
MPVDLSQPLESLPDPLPIEPITRPFAATIQPPGSKSITNRALLLAALADGASTLRGALVDADDAKVMIAALRKLGAKIEVQPTDRGDTLRVVGVNGSWRNDAEITLDLHNAGTATRFLAAAAILAGRKGDGHAGTLDAGHAPIVIDGDERMRQRPIRELTDALEVLHARVEFLGTPGYPPIRIHPRRDWMDPEELTFGRTASSQFISAVLLIAPWLEYGLTVRFGRGITSEPYVSMTIELLRRLKVPLIDNRPASVHIGHQRDPEGRPFPSVGPGVKAFDLDIEPDASGATYFQAAAALVPGARVTITGLDLGPRGSLQGDARFVSLLTAAGCRVERSGGLTVHGPERLCAVDRDLSDMPDTAMTAAVLACFAEGATTLRGLRTLRVKETDRLAALRTELTKLGASVEICTQGDDECLRITPPPALPPSTRGPGPSTLSFATYNDHRMAMALALVGLRVPGVAIHNPACVAKTYPHFWRDLARLYA